MANNDIASRGAPLSGDLCYEHYLRWNRMAAISLQLGHCILAVGL